MNTPPHINEMKPFEKDLVQTIENIRFRQVMDQFPTTLSNDLKKMQSSSLIKRLHIRR